jgi:hypothetical protein
MWANGGLNTKQKIITTYLISNYDFYGGEDGARTHDLLTASQAL